MSHNYGGNNHNQQNTPYPHSTSPVEEDDPYGGQRMTPYPEPQHNAHFQSYQPYHSQYEQQYSSHPSDQSQWHGSQQHGGSGAPGIGSIPSLGAPSPYGQAPPPPAPAAYNGLQPHHSAGTPVQLPYGDEQHYYHHQPSSSPHLQPPSPNLPPQYEDTDAMLLKPLDGAPVAQPGPRGRSAFHVLGMNNDDDYYAGSDDETFTPFPVAGDHYPLNTYSDDEDTYTEGDEEEEEVESDEEDQYSYTDEDPYRQPLMPPPDEQPRRRKTTKRVRLYKGNLVLDCPVSQKLLSQYDAEVKMDREFTHMRYSAATCDPAQFVSNNFTLRQTCYNIPRETEIFICVTIYNEDDILLGRTLQGIFHNIKHLTRRTRSKTWGPDSWKKVVVCIIADGRFKIHPRAKALLASLGVYQEGFAKNVVNDKTVDAHIYEYTSMIGISKVGKTVSLTTEKTPVQMIFCLKEKNKKKINSHRWFFQAFSPILRPKVCVLLDAGTKPGNDSIYHLWKAFDLHPRVGGACGEIRAGLGTGWRKLLNPLVAAQNFEYKMSNILDKPMESSFGFITVLPGAFSAYRYEALLNDMTGRGPLEKYFKGETETLKESNAGIFTANMYLAEDRILCFELVAKRGCNWLLKYVKSAHAETDVPDKLAELVLQRRRWLNGSFFAAIYAQAHMFSLWRSAHSVRRKLMLHVEFLYQTVSMLFSWFSPGNFFLVFRILTNSLGDSAMGFAPGHVLSVILLWTYCGCIITIFVLSFGNRPGGTQAFYIIMVGFFSFLMAYLIFATIYISVKSVKYAICENNGFSVSLVFGNATFRDLVVSMLSTYALYIVSSLMFFEPWHLLTSFIQYLIISASYINVLNVYAFCNIHDISWGTKGDTELKTDLGVAKTNQAGKLEVDIPTSKEEIDVAYLSGLEALADPPVKVKEIPNEDERNKDYYALFRSSVVLAWLFTNIALIAVVLSTAGQEAVQSDGSSSSGNTGNTGGSSGDTSAALMARELFADLVARQDSGSANNCGSLGSSGTIRTQIYLSVVLWSVAALAGFRFVGSAWFVLMRLLGR